MPTTPLDLAAQREALQAAHENLLRSEVLLSIRQRSLDDAERLAGEARARFEYERSQWDSLLGYPPKAIRSEPLGSGPGWQLEELELGRDTDDVWAGHDL